MSVSRNIKLLAWHNFFTDFWLYAPVAILYFTQVSGSYARGMSVFAIAMLTQALFEIPTGIFSDLIGRARTMTLGSLAIVMGSVAYAIGANYWWLVLGAILEGLSRAFYSGNNDALLHDTLTELNRTDEYADKLGKLSSMFQIALAAAAILGGVIANWSFAWVVWLSVIPQVICLIISLKLIEPKVYEKYEVIPYTHLKEAWQLFIHNPKLRILTSASAIGNSVGEALFQFNATFISMLWPIWAIGIAKALSYAGGAVGFITAGKLIKKYKELPLIMATEIYSRFISMVAYIFPSMWSPLLLATPSVFYGTVMVADSTLKQKQFSTKQRATMGSLDSFLGSVLMGIMMLAVGIMADKIGATKTLLVMQFFLLIPIYLYWLLWRGKAKEK